MLEIYPQIRKMRSTKMERWKEEDGKNRASIAKFISNTEKKRWKKIEKEN